MKLETAVETYVAHLRNSHLSQAHINSVVIRLARFSAGRQLADLSTIQPADIDDHFDHLRHVSGLADGTLAGHKSTLRAFWNYCLENQLTEENPTAVLRRKKHGYSYKPVRSRAVPRDDYLKVMHALPAFTAHRDAHPRDLRDAAMVSLVADSSARRGELYELRRKDLVEALRLGADVGGGVTVYHVITRGKTGAVTIRFFAETADLLRRWLQHVPADSPFVFISLRTGKRLRLDAMWLGFKRICEFAGVPPFRFHATRKRVVTDIIESSGDMKVGQLLANHRSPRTTQEYYNDIQQSRVDAAAAALAGQRAAPQTDIASAFFGRVDRR